ncbi:MAG: DNA primase [Methanobrevibacter sp.]|jgi:DNA primase large subunit|nr:DNA primase [Candidatus Methanoflexus mossambicus]
MENIFESNLTGIGFINPLSPEGKRILKENINLDDIFNENNDLTRIIMQIGEGILDDDKKIPKNYVELGLKRLEWFFREKNDKNFKSSEFSYLYKIEIEKYDVIVFHLLSQAIAYKFNLNGREAKLFLDSQNRLIEERLERIADEIKEDLINDILNDLSSDIVEFNWINLIPLIASKKIDLKDLLLKNGKIILNEDEFREEFYEETEDWNDRRINMVFNSIVGLKTKELIMSQIIIQKTEDYLENIQKNLKIIEIHPAIKEFADLIEKEYRKWNEKYSTVYGEVMGGDIKQERLIKDAFPPCVLRTIEGVKSGNRNDAIVLFLTSFISYARLYPQIFKLRNQMKISELDPDLKITTNEILPIIFEAADNAVPPLFEDQPQEKINIISKLGFGMHNEPDLNHEGETKWYTPMSCDKIKMHLSNLCHPDAICNKIGNPITYYSLKKWQIKKDGNIDKNIENTKK